MHRLYLEETWEKNVSPEIRKKIEQQFKNKVYSPNRQFDILWTAKNHRGHLLVITLIHNELDNDLSLLHEQIGLYKNNHLLTDTYITEEKCTIPKNASMPWTFIFRNHAQIDSLNERTDELELRIIPDTD